MILPYPTSPIRFRTFPDDRLLTGNHFKFVVSSCIIPNHPYNGPLSGRTIKGFDLLSDYLYPPTVEADPPFESETSNTTIEITSEVAQTKVPVEFLLFLGDFIYADVPLYIGDNKEAYRRLYRRNYQSDSFRKVYERLREFTQSTILRLFAQFPKHIHSHLPCL